ncbi:MAG: fimbrillin family protein [Marinilabiliaceae bacterium]|nr:fimbrillin family protein [Marinilabiliaceae bacterium]
MKRIINLGLIITAISVTSCTKDEVSNINQNDANVIGFELSTGKTRASVNDINNLETDANGFGVFATNKLTPEMFIDNGKYRFNTVGNVWVWDREKMFWPDEEDEYPINFYAYYPYSQTQLNESLKKDYTIASIPEDQIDLLAAHHLEVVTRPPSNDIPLSFKHILSKIDFKVVTAVDATVEVQSIAIRNVGNKGTFDYSGMIWSELPTTNFNSDYSYMKAPVAPENIFVGTTNPTNVTGSGGSFMLMPQDLSNRGWNQKIATLGTLSYIEVVYRMYETESGKDIVGYTVAEDHPNYSELGNNIDGSLFVKVGYPLPTEWFMNKAYNYVLYLDGTSSGGTLIDGNFIDEDGDTTELPVVDPETEEPIEPEDPIFTDKPIGFFVVVADWGIENKPL